MWCVRGSGASAWVIRSLLEFAVQRAVDERLGHPVRRARPGRGGWRTRPRTCTCGRTARRPRPSACGRRGSRSGRPPLEDAELELLGHAIGERERDRFGVPLERVEDDCFWSVEMVVAAAADRPVARLLAAPVEVPALAPELRDHAVVEDVAQELRAEACPVEELRDGPGVLVVGELALASCARAARCTSRSRAPARSRRAARPGRVVEALVAVQHELACRARSPSSDVARRSRSS